MSASSAPGQRARRRRKPRAPSRYKYTAPNQRRLKASTPGPTDAISGPSDRGSGSGLEAEPPANQELIDRCVQAAETAVDVTFRLKQEAWAEYGPEKRQCLLHEAEAAVLEGNEAFKLCSQNMGVVEARDYMGRPQRRLRYLGHMVKSLQERKERRVAQEKEQREKAAAGVGGQRRG